MTLLIYAIPLLWAAVWDYRKRIIPDWTWIAILLIGIVSAVLLPSPPNLALYERIAGLLIPGLCLLFLAVKYGGVGGGDIKLTAALGFAFGLPTLAAFLLFALPPACIYAAVTRQRSVPLAVFLCIGAFSSTGVFYIAGLF